MGGLVSGKFSIQEDDIIRANYQTMTCDALAQTLNREKKSVENRICKLGLKKKTDSLTEMVSPKKNRVAYMAALSDEERKGFLRKELRGSSTYKQIKPILSNEDLEYYEDKYIDFMMDPTIETMTIMEKDALHDMTMAQIRMFQYMRDEKIKDVQGRTYSKAKEIRECQEIIQHCQESLNVQRKQRLKNANDQAVNFTSIVRELKDPNLRREIGYEAAMLKYIGQRYYLDHLRTGNREGNIISGRSAGIFEIDSLFIKGAVPSGLGGEFL